MTFVKRTVQFQWLLICQTLVWTMTVGLATTEDSLGTTIADLFAGGSVTAGGARFDSWKLMAVDATSGSLPNFSQITVVPLVNDLANPGLQIQSNGQLTTLGINALDMYLQFRVSALAGGNTFKGHELNLSSVAFGDLTGTAVISQELGSFGGELGGAVAVADNTFGIFSPLSSGSFVPRSSFTVNVNVFLNGLTSTIDLGSYSHRFSQTGPAAVPGDYNQDGTVDAADYTVWRDNLGAPPLTLPNDTTGGVIGTAQYNLWKSKFGQSAGSGAGVIESGAVPEPTTLTLLFIAYAVLHFRCRTKSPYHV